MSLTDQTIAPWPRGAGGLTTVQSGEVPEDGSADGEIIQWLDPNGRGAIWRWNASLTAWVLWTSFGQRWLFEDWSSGTIRPEVWDDEFSDTGNYTIDAGNNELRLDRSVQASNDIRYGSTRFRVPFETTYIASKTIPNSSDGTYLVGNSLHGFFAGTSASGNVYCNLEIENVGDSIRNRLFGFNANNQVVGPAQRIAASNITTEHHLTISNPADRDDQNNSDDFLRIVMWDEFLTDYLPSASSTLTMRGSSVGSHLSSVTQPSRLRWRVRHTDGTFADEVTLGRLWLRG